MRLIKLLTISLLSIVFHLQVASQETFTIGDIYNYEVGNIFQYFTETTIDGSTFYKKTQREVIDKSYDANISTAYYHMQYIEWHYNSDFSDSTLEEDVHLIGIPNFNSNLSYSSIHNDYCDDMLLQAIDSVKNSNETLIRIQTNRYAIGLGLTSYYRTTLLTGSTTHQYLTYYNKGDSICGVSDPIFETQSTKGVQAKNQFSIYPNPAQDFIYIESPITQISTLEILDLSGKLIQQHSISPSNKSITLNGLDQGVYLIRMGEHIQKLLLE